MTNTDTPSPLAAAAEALTRRARKVVWARNDGASHMSDEEYGAALVALLDACSAVDAALASDAAWRARAEAAVALVQAEAAWLGSINGWVDAKRAGRPSGISMKDTTEPFRAAYDAARRRYEEARRG